MNEREQEENMRWSWEKKKNEGSDIIILESLCKEYKNDAILM